MNWISVKERLPELYRGVLVSDGNIMCTAELISMGDKFRFTGHGFSGYEWEFDFGDSENITHWQPLPPPPEEGK